MTTWVIRGSMPIASPHGSAQWGKIGHDRLGEDEQYDGIDRHRGQRSTEQLVERRSDPGGPQASEPDGVDFERPPYGRRQPGVHEVNEPIGALHEDPRRQDGRGRDGDEDWRERVRHHARPAADRDDDEAELAHLSEREPRDHRASEADARQQARRGHAEELTGDDGDAHDHRRTEVGDDLGGIDDHPDRHEEDRGEDVPERLDDPLDRLRHARLGDEDARDERPERDRVAQRIGELGHREAEADRPDRPHLGRGDPRTHAHQARHDQKPAYEQENDREPEAAQRRADLLGIDAATRRDARHDGDEDDRHHVLNDEDAEDVRSYLRVDALIGENTGHHHRARDADARPRESCSR
jgi:hypothetical protein